MRETFAMTDGQATASRASALRAPREGEPTISIAAIHPRCWDGLAERAVVTATTPSRSLALSRCGNGND